MNSTIEPASCRYQGIVFTIVQPTPDFSCSREVVLPGKHTSQRAWQLVFAELQGARAAELSGGDVRRC